MKVLPDYSAFAAPLLNFQIAWKLHRKVQICLCQKAVGECCNAMIWKRLCGSKRTGHAIITVRFLMAGQAYSVPCSTKQVAIAFVLMRNDGVF